MPIGPNMPIMPKAYWAYYVKPIGPNMPNMPIAH